MQQSWSRALVATGLALAALAWAASASGGPVRGQAATESVDLVNGCTNVALTWPAGTPIATVAAAINPAEALLTIWKLDAASQLFLGYAPDAQQASDLTVVNPLDAVYICTKVASVLIRPVLGTAIATVPTAPVVVPLILQVITASDAAPRGGTAFVVVQAPVGARCDIQYQPPAGTLLSTTGLGPQIVPPTGIVTWIWTIAPQTVTGKATVVVTCAGSVTTLMITIT